MFSRLLLGAALLSSAVLVNADMVTKEYEVGAFTGIELTGASSVKIIHGDTPAVSVSIDRDYLPRVKVEVDREGRLLLDVHEKGWFGGSAKGDFVVTASSLDLIELSGSGSLTAERIDSKGLLIALKGSGDARFDEINVKTMRIELMGSGDIDIEQLAAVTMDASIMGSGDITLTGAAVNVDVEIMGSGDFDGRELDTEVTKGVVLGSGDIVVKSAASSNFNSLGSGRGKVLKERP